jgi:hypothetical protein
MFSFCTTLGAASVAWASFAFRVPHGESADRGNACTFPLYSCGSGEPCRSLQCDFEAGKVNPKTSISTSFSRFCPDLADIYRFLSGFGQFSSPARFSKTPHRSTPQTRAAGRESPSVQPEKYLLLWNRRSNRLIQRIDNGLEQHEMFRQRFREIGC